MTKNIATTENHVLHNQRDAAHDRCVSPLRNHLNHDVAVQITLH
jgi:hypothetical protein